MIPIANAEAFKAGFDEGVNQGREEIFNEMRNVVDQKLDNFTEMINEVLKMQETLIQNEKKEVYIIIRNLTKWIIYGLGSTITILIGIAIHLMK